MERFIFLRKPTDLKSKTKEIKSHLDNGCKTSEVKLIFNFVAPDNVLESLGAEFTQMKNRIAFNSDTRFN